jgi:uncharacterized protein (DUF1778 family)
MLNKTVPNQIIRTQTMRSQTKACSARLSYEISALLRYYAALSGNSLVTFWENIAVPSSKRIEKSK